jgi:hypothetical protein
MEVMFDMIAKHLTFSRILSAVHLVVSKTIAGCFIGKKLYNKTARRFPLGYCLAAEKK